jgi:cytochrome c oxidase subunit 2
MRKDLSVMSVSGLTKRWRASRAAAPALLTLASLQSGCGRWPSLAPATPQGDAIIGLFNLVLLLSAAVLALVMGLLLFVLLRFRRRPGEPLAPPSRVRGDRKLELLWTAGPLALVVVLFVAAVQTMRTVAAQSDPAEQDVEVIGHQWWWEYRYSDARGVTPIFAANELHLPVEVSTRLLLSSQDVQHDFWVPQFGWKRDLYPGRTNTLGVRLRELGVFDGACAEYCGAQHAWMRIRVVAEPRDRFEAWLRNQAQPARPPVSSAEQRGQQVFLANTCVNCHAIGGTSAIARVGPDLTHFGSRSLLGSGVANNTPAELDQWIRNPHEVKPGVLMPGYTSLSDEDVRALVTYLQSLT